jgi:ubiquinone/menaquinone biosynthesis C-methylase UbiE
MLQTTSGAREHNPATDSHNLTTCYNPVNMKPLRTSELLEHEEKAWHESPVEGPKADPRFAFEHKREMVTMLDHFWKDLFKDAVSKLNIKAKTTPALLEIAGGSGWASIYLSNALIGEGIWPQKSKFVLTDCSPSALKKSKQVLKYLHEHKLYPDAKISAYSCCDAHRLPFSSESFDVVFICAALHHMASPQKVFQEISRVLKPGGILLSLGEPVVAPYFQGIYRRISSAGERSNELGILEQTFTYRQLTKLLSQNFSSYKIVANRDPHTRAHSPLRKIYYTLTSFIPGKILMKLAMTGVAFVAYK